METIKAYGRLMIIVYTIIEFSLEAFFATLFSKKSQESYYRRKMVEKSETLIKRCGSTIEVNGIENFEKNKTYLLMANHQSYTDIIVMFNAMGKANRRVGFMSKREIFFIPFVGPAMKHFQCVAIYRGNKIKTMKTFNNAITKIKEGVDLLIFPEGTRGTKRELLPLKKGGSLMARKAGVDIMPVAIRGTDKFMPKKGFKAYPSDIKIEFLKPVSIEGKNDEEIMREVEFALKEGLKGYKLEA